MILDELVLHDFGVYGGRQILRLTPPSPDKPIILVGGLNGGGKTTLLEGLQLCLFGSAAPALGRTPGGYLEHLRRRIHRGSGASSAAVELAFRHTTNGVEHDYRAIRSWSIQGDSCRETFEVLRDGALDRLATDNWAEQVEEFMPARIASLFLFDGEKVESYADPDEAPALVATAIQNLLGLDLVERLASDLAILERRRRAELADDGTISAAQVARIDLSALGEKRLQAQRDAAAVTGALDRARQQLKKADERFRREGGPLYEQRSTIEAEAKAAEQRMAEAIHEVREAAGGLAPLILVEELLEGLRTRDGEEREIVTARQLSEALGDEHQAILGLPAIAGLPASEFSQVRTVLAERRAIHAERAARPIRLHLGDQTGTMLAGLLDAGLAEARETIERLIGRAAAAREALDQAVTALSAVPSGDSLGALQQERAALRAEVLQLETQARVQEEALAALDREIAQLRERETRLAELEAVERFRGEDGERMVAHSAKVRGTLLRFREAVVARHVERIQRLVLESFQRLVRKPGLVSDLRIDPASFRLTIVGGDGLMLAPAQLSAGERQLLAVALVWGMARASGRPLPTIIDTPLGRLDSEHRSRLVERYFPHASHQVLLLSTDEEIAGGYREALSPWVGRSYRLEFDPVTRRTCVEEGYVEDGALRHVA